MRCFLFCCCCFLVVGCSGIQSVTGKIAQVTRLADVVQGVRSPQGGLHGAEQVIGTANDLQAQVKYSDLPDKLSLVDGFAEQASVDKRFASDPDVLKIRNQRQSVGLFHDQLVNFQNNGYSGSIMDSSYRRIDQGMADIMDGLVNFHARHGNECGVEAVIAGLQ